MKPRILFTEYSDRITKRDDGCWLWTGATTDEGYGQLRRDGERFYVHRVAAGDVPDGKQVNHHCDVRNCCNPDHVYVGTHAENMRDAAERGAFDDNGNPEHLVRCSPEHENFTPISEVEGFPEIAVEGAKASAKAREPLTADERDEVRAEYERDDVSQRDLADAYDASLGYINKVLNDEV